MKESDPWDNADSVQAGDGELYLISEDKMDTAAYLHLCVQFF